MWVLKNLKTSRERLLGWEYAAVEFFFSQFAKWWRAEPVLPVG